MLCSRAVHKCCKLWQALSSVKPNELGCTDHDGAGLMKLLVRPHAAADAHAAEATVRDAEAPRCVVLPRAEAVEEAFAELIRVVHGQDLLPRGPRPRPRNPPQRLGVSTRLPCPNRSTSLRPRISEPSTVTLHPGDGHHSERNGHLPHAARSIAAVHVGRKRRPLHTDPKAGSKFASGKLPSSCLHHHELCCRRPVINKQRLNLGNCQSLPLKRPEQGRR